MEETKQTNGTETSKNKADVKEMFELKKIYEKYSDLFQYLKALDEEDARIVVQYVKYLFARKTEDKTILQIQKQLEQ